MKKGSVKKGKVKELDLLPVMNLFSILVTVVISMATFEKLGVLELWLPERSETVNPDKPNIDEGLLNLTVVISEKGIVVGAAGGFQPTVYYQEEVEYRSRSDKNLFRKLWVKGETVKSPTDGKIMTPPERESIYLNMISKKDSVDPGTYRMSVLNIDGDALLDTAGNWLSTVPANGTPYRIVGDQIVRKMTAKDAQYCRVTKLSAYSEVARQLEKIHQSLSLRENLPPDADDVVILAGEGIIYDKIIQLMDACKAAGYDKIALSLIGEGV